MFVFMGGNPGSKSFTGRANGEASNRRDRRASSAGISRSMVCVRFFEYPKDAANGSCAPRKATPCCASCFPVACLSSSLPGRVSVEKVCFAGDC